MVEQGLTGCDEEYHIHPDLPELEGADEALFACFGAAMLELQLMGLRNGLHGDEGPVELDPIRSATIGFKTGLMLARFYPTQADQLARAALTGAKAAPIRAGVLAGDVGSGMDVAHGWLKCASAAVVEYALHLRDTVQERRQRIEQLTADWKCRVCGCTNEHACQTPGGPCAWAAENLCTGCAR